MAKKATKKAVKKTVKKGSEERCEEDREEDQEGRQEEVTSSATIDAGGNAGDVTRACDDSLLLEADIDRSSGRRKRVSARHQVKRLDRHARGRACSSRELVRQRSRSFRDWRSLFGADHWSAVSSVAPAT